MSDRNSNRHYWSEQDVGCLALVILVVLVIGGSMIVSYLYRHERETKRLATAAARTHMDDIPSGSMITNDAWGRPMKFDRIANELQVTQIITSSGEDGKFGTADDIREQKTDLNKSRIIGKWVGTKSKEFVKGLVQGDKEPSRFEKFDHNEPTTQPTTKPSIWDRFRKKDKKGE